MLDTAWRQLRHGWSVTTTRRIRVADLHALITHVRATVAEFGRLNRDQLLEALGAAPDPEFRRSLDERRWRAVVRKAYEETTFYRQALDRLGLRPADLTLDRIAELPPTPKAVLRALPEAFVSARADVALQAFTTGTTGIPTSCWFSAYELDLAAGYGALSLMINVGVETRDVLALFTSSRAVLGGHTLLQAARLAGAGTVVCGTIDPAEALSRLATPVHVPKKKPRISLISVVPSYLSLLVRTGERLGYTAADFGVERILCGGEILTDALRARARAFFGAEIQETFAMTEVFPFGGQVCSHGHLHYNADHGLVEVLDPDGFTPTAPGEVGTLVITPFPPYRETTVVLRLNTGDLVRTLAGEPDCELAGQPATSRLLGKAALTTRTGDRPLYQREVLELLEAHPELPAPVRYGIEAADDGFDLHVHGPEDAVLLAELEKHAADAGLPVRKIVLHRAPDEVPLPAFNRALLHETTVVRDEETGTWALR
ncbi:MAG TPA: AMP-binding protein [Actinophytocola sp.]|uniref:phenylacetate--CoA ligase family protein n=1 Tax=Actinophytocola sp. TaxID=1872138 RepID=UPI002DB70EB0|nr:AMP-binding protein [Actinophytocola sp.]HEU5473393.1 AMP-binding protein [Actinophytocola sp.]